MNPSKLRLRTTVLLSALLFIQSNCPSFATPVVPSTAAPVEELTEPIAYEEDALSINVDQLSPAATPLLDSVMDEDLIAQNEPDPIPVLREGVSMGPSELENKIDNLTGRILLKQIELERYSINYNQGVAKQGRWKGWRYALFQEGNYALGLSGGIISVWNRGSHIHQPKKVRLHPQEAANYIPMIGGIIGASAAGLELGINQWHEIETHKNGFSPKQARKKVQGLKDEINAMLDERMQLVRVEESDPLCVYDE